MLISYIQAAMAQANHELLEDGSYYGEIPDFQGVWVDQKTLKACRTQLGSVLEDWILIHIVEHLSLPTFDDLELNKLV